MKIIESVANEIVKQTVKLHTSQGRKEQNAFIAEGKRTCQTFIEHEYIPLELFITKDHTSFAKLVPSETIVTMVSEIVMKKMSTASTPSGILCVFEIPKKPEVALSSGIVLANITDPGNMGTLIRSAAAFGFKTVVIVEGCDPFSPKSLQASAGSLPLINLYQWSWKELMNHKNKVHLAALVVENGTTIETLPSSNVLFVVGNEAHGLPQEWANSCHSHITIPMSLEVDSLNAAIAGTVALALYRNKL